MLLTSTPFYFHTVIFNWSRNPNGLYVYKYMSKRLIRLVSMDEQGQLRNHK